MKVQEFMTKEVQTVAVPGNRDEAMELIRDLKVSALPVVKKDTDEFVGMVRLRDFFENPDESQLGMLVNHDAVSVTTDQSLENVIELMLDNNVRRISVVEDGKLKGIITVRDIMHRVIAERGEETPILECMQNSITTIWDRTPLNVALEILNHSGERALPILDDRGKFVGMIGDEDIIAESEIKTEEKSELMGGRSESEKWTWDSEDRIYITKRNLRPLDKTVKEVMSTDLITISKRATASKCANLMKEKKVNQIPVVSGKKLIGMISDEDLLKSLIV